MRVHRLVDGGKLTACADPREPNPQHASRVSRAEVERLLRHPRRHLITSAPVCAGAL